MKKLAALEISLALSIFLHGFLLGLLVGFQNYNPTQSTTLEVSIIETPTTPLNTQPVKPMIIPTQTSKTSKKAVPTTGVSRNSTVSESDTAAKIGNTLSKAPDNLPPTDDGLPPATEDFLVNKWPMLQNDVRTPYPRDAKQKGVEGAVVMDLYIDGEGRVKKVKLVRGPGYGLNEAALEAAKQFLFSPAKVGEKAVPVVIRYSYKFVIQK
ncbi:MAG: TonB family protein [Oligoflexia bacterium]|nr:TonB family protein [Oligoflexia bacterium]